MKAQLENVELGPEQEAVLLERGQPCPEPAEQLALLRAERLTKIEAGVSVQSLRFVLLIWIFST